MTIPHALGLCLPAFALLGMPSMALWSVALPILAITLLLSRPGVVYAPTTVVALMFVAALQTVGSVASPLGMDNTQVLAASGATMALGFAFQWLIGALRLATLARFLPISVAQGFAAGVGLSIVLSQVHTGFGAGSLLPDAQLAWHAGAALAVVALALWGQWHWPRAPALLPVVALVAAVVVAFGWDHHFNPAMPLTSFAWPGLPDWRGVPWLALLSLKGAALLSLAFLMALVNSLEILVFNQELALEHGIATDANRALCRESLVAVVLALLGLIPASTSASRSRIVLQAGPPNRSAPLWHAVLMLGVGLTGFWWLHWVPMACLAGALLMAGYKQVPAMMWSRRVARAVPATLVQSWLVALVFAIAGGVGALVTGLFVATVLLLRQSGSRVIRRAHLDGQLRSRRQRRAAAEDWLNPRIGSVAVFELQGVMSFGVAAYLAEQISATVRSSHRFVLLDASRVPAWDSTALAQLRALVRNLEQRGAAVALAALDAAAQQELDTQARVFYDLDHALEWAEGQILETRTPADMPVYPAREPLGELGEGLGTAARNALEAHLQARQARLGEQVFAAGEQERALLIVQSGHITLATRWPAHQGLRLATFGPGMPFGEMAFLTGATRSASAGAEHDTVALLQLNRAAFDAWALAYPQDALVFMRNLALLGARRLAGTTRQLRAALE